jgi:L-lactate dehydrogenase
VLEGEYGLSGVSLGVPCILSQKGVERILQVNLPPEEKNALARSAAILQEMIAQLKLPGTS